MNAEAYYQSIAPKWEEEYPSSDDMGEVWSFYKECGYENPEKTVRSLVNLTSWTKHRVLDLGCDNGLMLRLLCDWNASVSGFGIDINAKAIVEAQRRFPDLSFKAFDGVSIPFEDKYFDLVFVCAVAKHIRYEDRGKFYQEITRVSDYVCFIEVDSQKQEVVAHHSWTFYNSNFAEEFSLNFTPIEVVKEAGDILGLYKCRNGDN
jgi:SAM-dependent methyltransferase